MVALASQVKELREAQWRTKAERHTHRNPHIFVHFWGYSLLAAGTALLFSSHPARFLLRWGCASLAGPTFPSPFKFGLFFADVNRLTSYSRASYSFRRVCFKFRTGQIATWHLILFEIFFFFLVQNLSLDFQFCPQAVFYDNKVSKRLYFNIR